MAIHPRALLLLFALLVSVCHGREQAEAVVKEGREVVIWTSFLVESIEVDDIPCLLQPQREKELSCVMIEGLIESESPQITLRGPTGIFSFIGRHEEPVLEEVHIERQQDGTYLVFLSGHWTLLASFYDISSGDLPCRVQSVMPSVLTCLVTSTEHPTSFRINSGDSPLRFVRVSRSKRQGASPPQITTIGLVSGGGKRLILSGRSLNNILNVSVEGTNYTLTQDNHVSENQISFDLYPLASYSPALILYDQTLSYPQDPLEYSVPGMKVLPLDISSVLHLQSSDFSPNLGIYKFYFPTNSAYLYNTRINVTLPQIPDSNLFNMSMGNSQFFTFSAVFANITISNTTYSGNTLSLTGTNLFKNSGSLVPRVILDIAYTSGQTLDPSLTKQNTTYSAEECAVQCYDTRKRPLPSFTSDPEPVGRYPLNLTVTCWNLCTTQYYFIDESNMMCNCVNDISQLVDCDSSNINVNPCPEDLAPDQICSYDCGSTTNLHAIYDRNQICVQGSYDPSSNTCYTLSSSHARSTSVPADPSTTTFTMPTTQTQCTDVNQVDLNTVSCTVTPQSADSTAVTLLSLTKFGGHINVNLHLNSITQTSSSTSSTESSTTSSSESSTTSSTTSSSESSTTSSTTSSSESSSTSSTTSSTTSSSESSTTSSTAISTISSFIATSTSSTTTSSTSPSTISSTISSTMPSTLPNITAVVVRAPVTGGHVQLSGTYLGDNSTTAFYTTTQQRVNLTVISGSSVNITLDMPAYPGYVSPVNMTITLVVGGQTALIPYQPKPCNESNAGNQSYCGCDSYAYIPYNEGDISQYILVASKNPTTCLVDVDLVNITRILSGQTQYCTSLLAAALNLGVVSLPSLSFCSPKSPESISNYLTNTSNVISVNTAKTVISQVLSPQTNDSLSKNVTLLYTILQQTITAVLRTTTNFTLVTSDISITAVQYSGSDTTTQVRVENSSSSATFPAATLQQFSANTTATIVVTVLRFNPFANVVNTSTYSSITAVQLLGQDGSDISVKDTVEPIEIVLSLTTQLPLNSVYTCLYWDEIGGKWSSDGCNVSSVTESTLICACNHLTNFTAGATAKVNKSPPTASTNLGLIIGVVVGGVVLLVALVALIVFFVIKRRNQTKMQNLDMELDPMNGAAVSMIPAEQIQIISELGTGSSTKMYKANYQHSEVALKKFTGTSSAVKITKETDIIKSLHHPYVVQYLGICQMSYTEMYTVSEYVPGGDLAQQLRRRKKAEGTNELVKLRMVGQIASAMSYIHDQQVIHGDLSARNILVRGDTDDMYDIILKLTNFSKSRRFSDPAAKDSHMPVRWTAPECLKSGVATHYNDVWAFGVTAWEIYNDGDIPYGGKKDEEVTSALRSGLTLSMSYEPLRDIITQCWHDDEKKRPSWKEINTVISELNSHAPTRPSLKMSPSTNQSPHISLSAEKMYVSSPV